MMISCSRSYISPKFDDLLFTVLPLKRVKVLQFYGFIVLRFYSFMGLRFTVLKTAPVKIETYNGDPCLSYLATKN